MDIKKLLDQYQEFQNIVYDECIKNGMTMLSFTYIRKDDTIGGDIYTNSTMVDITKYDEFRIKEILEREIHENY